MSDQKSSNENISIYPKKKVVIDDAKFERDCSHTDFLPYKCPHCKNVEMCETCIKDHINECSKKEKKNEIIVSKVSFLENPTKSYKKQCSHCHKYDIFIIKCGIGKCNKDICLKCRHDHYRIHKK